MDGKLELYSLKSTGIIAASSDSDNSGCTAKDKFIQKVRVSRCCSRTSGGAEVIDRDVLCPWLEYEQRQALHLGRSQQEDGCVDSAHLSTRSRECLSNGDRPLEQPTAVRIAVLLRDLVEVGLLWTRSTTSPTRIVGSLSVIDANAGIGTQSSAFVHAFGAKQNRKDNHIRTTTVHAIEADPVQHAALVMNQRVFNTTGKSETANDSSTAFAQIHPVGHLAELLPLINGSSSTVDDTVHLKAAVAFVKPVPTIVTASGLASTVHQLLAGDADSHTGHRECELVAALVPAALDFDAFAAALVGVEIGASAEKNFSKDRCHPFSVFFERPAAAISHNALSDKQWAAWQLIIVTAPPRTSVVLPAIPSLLQYGNAKLDALVSALLNFNTRFKKEHRPSFYDWEKQRSFSLTRWKGVDPSSANHATATKPTENHKEKLTVGKDLDDQSTNESVPSYLGCCEYACKRPGATKLAFVLIVEGSLNDRGAINGGRDRNPSWVGFDRGYRGRRDALARCVAAILWANPGGATPGSSATDVQSVHRDTVCYLIHEASGEVLEIRSEFAQTFGQLPMEAELLQSIFAKDTLAAAAKGTHVTALHVEAATAEFPTADAEGAATAAQVAPTVLGHLGSQIPEAEKISKPKPTTKKLHATNREIAMQVRPGLRVWGGSKSVAAASELVLERVFQECACADDQSSRAILIELHEDKELRLPVYTAPGNVASTTAQTTILAVLGCVLDHSDSVAIFVESAQAAVRAAEEAKKAAASNFYQTPSSNSEDVGWSAPPEALQNEPKGWAATTRLHCVGVNLGPVSEFSSKIIHIMQDHHTERRLVPALDALILLPADQKQPTQPEGSSSIFDPTLAVEGDTRKIPTKMKGSASSSGKKLKKGLHFCVACPEVFLASLPTYEQCNGERQPDTNINRGTAIVLQPSVRPQAWRVARLVLATFARSRGSYSTNRLTLLLADGVLTLDADVVSRHLTAKRGWGAMTEHHLLVAVRDEITARPWCVQPDLSTAVARWGWGVGGAYQHRLVLVLDDGLNCRWPVVDLTTSGVDFVVRNEEEERENDLLGGQLMVALSTPGEGLLLRKQLTMALQPTEESAIAALEAGAQSSEVFAARFSPRGHRQDASLDNARMIMALQNHDNNGHLRPAVAKKMEL